MRGILEYFASPEEGMAELLYSKEKSKLSQTAIQGIMLAIVLGLLTIISYRMLGTEIRNMESVQNDILWGRLPLEKMSEGLQWISIAGIVIAKNIIIASIRIIVWILLLIVVKHIFKYNMGIKDLLLVITTSQVIWIAIQLVLVGIEIVFIMIPMQGVHDIVIGMLSVFSYWYLILIAIGFSIGCKTSLLRGGATIFILQAGLWGIVSVVPFLQAYLG